MARYTTSKTKLSSRVRRNLYLKGSRSFSAKDDYTKKVTRASSRRRGKRPKSLSEFGKQLLEKQALKFTYGLQEKQLANLFKAAFQKSADTATTVLTKLELRLDNVIYRAGLANSRSQARQLVNHGHFDVNGVKTDIPSMPLKPGDIVIVRENKKKKNFWVNFQLEVPNSVPSWLDTSKPNQARILNLPIKEDLPEEFNMLPIVELYSRKVG